MAGEQRSIIEAWNFIRVYKKDDDTSYYCKVRDQTKEKEEFQNLLEITRKATSLSSKITLEKAKLCLDLINASNEDVKETFKKLIDILEK